MSDRPKSLNALKHGAYSEAVVLPGESVAEFEKLHRDLVDELAPDGPLEDDIVWSIARLVWRKRNLKTYRIAATARKRIAAIQGKLAPVVNWSQLGAFQTQEPSESERAAVEDELRAARKELGKDCVLVGAEEATTGFLLEWLVIEERLDALIDKYLKRLLMVRGVKSMKVLPS